MVQKLLELLAKRRVEACPAELLFHRLLFVLGEKVDAHEALGLFGRSALGEVHDVNRRLPVLEQSEHRVVQTLLAVRKIERHRPIGALHQGRRHAGEIADRLLEHPCLPKRRTHQKKSCLGQGEQRNLPRDPPVPVRVVVELIHHDAINLSPLAFPQREIGQNLGGAADYGRLTIDRRISGHHPHPLRPQHSAQVEELLAHQSLDRCGVERTLPERDRPEVGGQRHQRLPRTGRRVEDHVVADEELHDRLFLSGVELEPLVAGVLQEPCQQRVAVDVLVQVI